MRRIPIKMETDFIDKIHYKYYYLSIIGYRYMLVSYIIKS